MVCVLLCVEARLFLSRPPPPPHPRTAPSPPPPVYFHARSSVPTVNRLTFLVPPASLVPFLVPLLLFSEAFETLKQLVAMKANHAGYRLALSVAYEAVELTVLAATATPTPPTATPPTPTPIATPITQPFVAVDTSAPAATRTSEPTTTTLPRTGTSAPTTTPPATHASEPFTPPTTTNPPTVTGNSPLPPPASADPPTVTGNSPLTPPASADPSTVTGNPPPAPVTTPVVIPLLRVLLHDLFALQEIQRQAKRDATTSEASGGGKSATALDLGALKSWYVGTRSLLGISKSRGFTSGDDVRAAGQSGSRGEEGRPDAAAVLETLLQARVSTVQVKQLSQLWNEAEAIRGLAKSGEEPFANPRKAVAGLSNIGLV